MRGHESLAEVIDLRPGSPAAPMAPLAELPEERVVALALGGQREAWDALIASHGHRVLVSLLARGARVDIARDLAQETWSVLIARQRAGQLDRLELPGLAITQAHFLLLEHRRASARAASPLDDASAPPDPAPSAEDRLLSRQQLARAHDELQRCPPRARDVFALVYDNPGLPHAEAARRTGLSVQRVRQTLCEVRARLRAVLESNDEPS